MKKFIVIVVSSVFLLVSTQAATVLTSDWDDVVYGRCSDQNTAWWSSAEAIRVAENVLLYQKQCGGWPKNINMQVLLTQQQKDSLLATQTNNAGATIDNEAVKLELKYLSKVYAAIADDVLKQTYKTAFLNGIDYLLEAQYENGGWPQFYPYRGGYSDHITYNDNAMLNVMNTLRAIYSQSSEYSIPVEEPRLSQAKTAFDKGIDCILNTQYVQNGKLTAWCAQHHYLTLQPVMARSYELASLSGYESKAIAQMLMSIENPSFEIRRAIYAAASWYKEVALEGIRLESFINADGLSDKRVVQDPAAPDLWARFYTLDTNTPFFCDRDGIIKYSLAEIGYERRTGYSWYTNVGFSVITNYESWFPVNGNASERDAVLSKQKENTALKTVLCYPNPAQTSFSIDLKKIGPAKIEIYNLTGKLVYTDYAVKDTHTVISHQLTQGTYVVKVFDIQHNLYSQKIIMQ